MNSNVNRKHVQLSANDLMNIKKEVAYYRNELQVNRIIGDDIFKVLEQECRVMYYPVRDHEICAFYRQVNDIRFVFINTAIP